MREFLALVDSLPPQPSSPIQVRYRVHSANQNDLAASIELAFWDIGQYRSASLTVETSSSLAATNPIENRPIPYRGSIVVDVIAPKPGYYHLRIETEATTSDGAITNTILIPVPIGQHATDEASPGPAGGFAGPRLKALLESQRREIE